METVKTEHNTGKVLHGTERECCETKYEKYGKMCKNQYNLWAKCDAFLVISLIVRFSMNVHGPPTIQLIFIIFDAFIMNISSLALVWTDHTMK